MVKSLFSILAYKKEKLTKSLFSVFTLSTLIKRKKLTKSLFSVCIFLTSFAFALPPQFGGTLIFGKSGEAVSLDPSHETDGESFYIAQNVYDTLVDHKSNSMGIEPSLALSWQISDDGLNYTFKLRKNVYFSNTRYFKQKSEFTAADVVFSFKRQFDKSHKYHNIGGSFATWNAMNMSNIIEDVIALDRYTVEFKLKRIEAPFLANLGMEFASILSNDYAMFLDKRKKQNQIGEKPVGTGPFVFKKWVKDDKLILKTNENYWNGKPFLDKLIFKIITNSQVRASQLKNASIHIMDFPNPHEINSLESSKNIKLVKKDGLNIAYLTFNQEKKPFDNKFVRQAISHAINVEKIIDEVYEGYGKIATNPIPPRMWSYNDKLKGYKYDIKKAKDLLIKAGFKDGFTTNLWAMPLARPYNPNARKMAKLMQEDLRKVGIKIKIISYDWKSYLRKSSMGEHEMLLGGWTSGNGDPDDFLNILLSKHAALRKPTENKAFWKNDAFTHLIEQARQTTNIDKRTSFYKQAQVIFEEEAPWKPLAHQIVVVPMLNKVHGFKLDSFGKREFRNVWIEK